MNSAHAKFSVMAGRVLSRAVLSALERAKAFIKVAAARVAFALASPDQQVLSIKLLSKMAKNYPEPPKVRYDPEGLILRGETNIRDMSTFVDMTRVHSALELGCKDGMSSAALAQRGIRSFALDISRVGAGAAAFDRRGREAGVTFVQADATQLPFDSGTLELIFSFDSFEHFSNPRAVLCEAARVLVPSGQLFLEFGPVATAPYGLHAYRSVAVPYLNVLFDVNEVRELVQRQGRSFHWPFINNASPREYRKMFAETLEHFKIIHYREHSSFGVGAELIVRYPGAFRRVSNSIGDFLVSTIVVLLERR